MCTSGTYIVSEKGVNISKIPVANDDKSILQKQYLIGMEKRKDIICVNELPQIRFNERSKLI